MSEPIDEARAEILAALEELDDAASGEWPSYYRPTVRKEVRGTGEVVAERIRHVANELRKMRRSVQIDVVP